MHLDLGHHHVHKHESLIFNYPDSYLKYTLENSSEYTSAFYINLPEQICILQNPRSSAGIFFISVHR